MICVQLFMSEIYNTSAADHSMMTGIMRKPDIGRSADIIMKEEISYEIC